MYISMYAYTYFAYICIERNEKLKAKQEVFPECQQLLRRIQSRCNFCILYFPAAPSTCA